MHVVHNNGKTVNLANPRMKFFRDRLEDLFKPVATELKTYAIPEHKFQPVVDFAMGVLIKNIKWRPVKIARKTAEYFKLKKADA